MRRLGITTATLIATTIAIAAAAAPAMAASTTCRASALRVQLLTLVQEPVVANPAGTECYTRTTPAGTIRADTYGADDGSYKVAQGHTFYGAAGVIVPGVLEFLTVNGAESQAFASCFEGQSQLSGWSLVNDVAVYPSLLAPPIVLDGSKPQTVPITGVGTLYVNREVKTANKITRQALFLDTPSVDTVIGESVAGMTC